MNQQQLRQTLAKKQQIHRVRLEAEAQRYLLEILQQLSGAEEQLRFVESVLEKAAVPVLSLQLLVSIVKQRFQTQENFDVQLSSQFVGFVGVPGLTQQQNGKFDLTGNLLEINRNLKAKVALFAEILAQAQRQPALLSQIITEQKARPEIANATPQTLICALNNPNHGAAAGNVFAIVQITPTKISDGTATLPWTCSKPDLDCCSVLQNQIIYIWGAYSAEKQKFVIEKLQLPVYIKIIQQQILANAALGLPAASLYTTKVPQQQYNHYVLVTHNINSLVKFRRILQLLETLHNSNQPLPAFIIFTGNWGVRTDKLVPPYLPSQSQAILAQARFLELLEQKLEQLKIEKQPNLVYLSNQNTNIAGQQFPEIPLECPQFRSPVLPVPCILSFGESRILFASGKEFNTFRSLVVIEGQQSINYKPINANLVGQLFADQNIQPTVEISQYLQNVVCGNNLYFGSQNFMDGFLNAAVDSIFLFNEQLPRFCCGLNDIKLMSVGSGEGVVGLLAGVGGQVVGQLLDF